MHRGYREPMPLMTLFLVAQKGLDGIVPPLHAPHAVYSLDLARDYLAKEEVGITAVN